MHRSTPWAILLGQNLYRRSGTHEHFRQQDRILLQFSVLRVQWHEAIESQRGRAASGSVIWKRRQSREHARARRLPMVWRFSPLPRQPALTPTGPFWRLADILAARQGPAELDPDGCPAPRFPG